MILFFIKKSFFDGWDHVFALALANVALSLFLVGEGFLSWMMLANRGGVPVSVVELLVLAAGASACSVAAGGVAWVANCMAEYRKAGFKDLWEGLKKTAGRSALFGLLAFAILTVMVIALRFYGQQGGVLGLLAIGFMFWVGLFVLLAFQWFFAVMVRLDGKFLKILRKCFLIALDNLGFSAFIWFWNAIGAGISVFTGGLAPGPCGILLCTCDALKLRVLKYDWLESNPGSKKSAVPWDELLKEDEELVGQRSLRGMIFPWKDQQR
jgi:hypothetical protein